MKTSGILASGLLIVGLLLLFISEKVLGTVEGVHTVALMVALAAILGGVAWRGVFFSQASGPAKSVEKWLLFTNVGVVISLAGYALTTEWGLTTVGLEGTAADRTDGTLSALWPAILIVSVLGLLFIEMPYRRMPVAEAIELRRVRASFLGGLSLGLALTFLFALNYIASREDIVKDVSYFQTTRPSEASRRMVNKLGEPIKVMLFYPQANEVLDQVRPYFQELDRASDKLTVELRDHALSPALARQHHVRGNGNVVLLKGTGDSQQAEQFEVGTDLEAARSRLRTLDSRFQGSFTKLVRIRREIHITTGHGEHTSAGAEDDSPGARISDLTDTLSRNNFTTRDLGLGQGLGNRVPEGAPAVMVIGPRRTFLREEAQSLLRYVQAGGRLFVMVDPNVEHGLNPLLNGLGVRLLAGVLCTETTIARRSYTDADHAIVATNRFTAHPAVTSMSRTQGVVFFVEGGALERYQGEGVLQGVSPTFPVRSGSDFWRDLNGNYRRDPDEPIETANMMAVVTVPAQGAAPEGRAVIISDGDFLNDEVVRATINGRLLGSILDWLIGQEDVLPETTSEEDIRVEHSQNEDKIYFWGTTLGAPLPILAIGLYVWTRNRRRKSDSPKPPERPKSEPKPPAPEAGPSAPSGEGKGPSAETSKEVAS